MLDGAVGSDQVPEQTISPAPSLGTVSTLIESVDLKIIGITRGRQHDDS